MKKLILVIGITTLLLAAGLRAYFALVPPPEPTLERALSDIFPSKMSGWQVEDQDISNSPESSTRISNFLKFDDSLFRIYQQGDVFVTLYIAYWAPGTASYRWAGAHTPDTCWVKAGWSCDERTYSVPFEHAGAEFEPAEFGIYSKDGLAQKVYFWHLVGGEAFGYQQQGEPTIFGALIDIKEYGLDLRQEQFFVRLSSNVDLDTLKSMNGFDGILDGLGEIGL
jgi:hypothetical protein